MRNHSFMTCIATKNRTGECACDNTIVVVEIENIEVVFKGFDMQILCMRTTCMWTFHIHIITMIKFSLSHHQLPLRLQCFPINYHHAWIETFCVISDQFFINQWFFIQMFYTCFLIFVEIVFYNDPTLTSFCFESSNFGCHTD